MKIATRNLLAELMIEALADPVAATALQCLAHYSRIATPLAPTITVEQLLEPTTALQHDSALTKLHTIPLLAWDLSRSSGQVTIASAFVLEWQEITDKLTRFSTALQDWSPDTKNTPRQQALKKGGLLFNHHLFFEVHEVLETQWRVESGREKIFFQGLIQIAVAFYHLQNRNLRGTIVLLQDGSEKLAPHQPTFLGIELREFLQHLEACRADLLRLGEQGLARFRVERIPRLQASSA